MRENGRQNNNFKRRLLKYNKQEKEEEMVEKIGTK